MSKYYNIPSFIGQGSALGPLLFSLYINDIGSVLNCDYILYADDLVLFTGDKNVDVAIDRLKLDLQRLNDWSINFLLLIIMDCLLALKKLNLW